MLGKKRLLFGIATAFIVAVTFQNCDNLDSPSGNAGLSSRSQNNLEIVLSKYPATVSSSNSATFEFASASSAVTFECSLDQGPFAACVSPKIFTGLSVGVHQLDVRAKDAN